MKVTRNRNAPLPTERKLVHYLFEDIARLPIITNRSQELWLGIQSRAGERLAALLAPLTLGGRSTPSFSPNGATPPRVTKQKPKTSFIQQHQIRASRDLSPRLSSQRSLKVETAMPTDLQRAAETPSFTNMEQSSTANWMEGSEDSQNYLLKVVETYIEVSNRLADTAAGTYWLPYVNTTEWAQELLVARHNIYSLHRSRLRQLLDRMAKQPGQQENDSILLEVYAVVELQALLPDDLLKYFIHHPPDDATPEPAVLINMHSAASDNATYGAWVMERTTRAKNQLATGYLRYALRIARNYAGRELEYPDLVQHAFLGLMKAAQRYDYRINARFGTYATSWIWQSVTRGLADESSLVRLPVHARESLAKLERIIIDRDTGVSDPLSDPELLAEAGFLNESDLKAVRSGGDENEGGPDTFHKAQRRARRLLFMTRALMSLDEDDEIAVHLEDDETGGSVTERLAAESTTDDYESLRPVVERLLERLTERQREIIELRFGLDDGRARTLEEIGQIVGVTRERIRQIEAKVLSKFERRMLRGVLPVQRDLLSSRLTWSIPQPRLPAVHPVESLGLAAAATGNEYRWLDRLLGRIPHSSWHAHRSGTPGFGVFATRAEQMAEALATLGAPSHYARVVEQVNELAGGRSPLEDTTGYNVMVSEESLFVLLGNGVFSLVEWEHARAQEQEPQLLFCPLALPDPPGFEDSLFESIFVGHEFLLQEPTAAEFLAYMLRWAEADPAVKPWLGQGILSTYYLLGLVPYTFVYAGENPRLRSTLPHEDVQLLRRYCLEMVTARLTAMPEFWWLLRNAQPARPVDIGEQLTEVHPHGLDDAQQRLYLLSSLGAAVRLPYGSYRLTDLGEACAADWGRSPDDETAAVFEIEDAWGGGLLDWGMF